MRERLEQIFVHSVFTDILQRPIKSAIHWITLGYSTGS